MADQYLVSARKYRPQTFDTVVGQEHITSTLKNAMRNNHLAHAFLFCGPRGVGKTSCARILAKTLNCQNQTSELEACGVCNNCIAFSNNTSFNVFELDAASNNKVDDIRALTEQVRFAPQQGKYKVYIIDEVHMLTTQAFNAFLKTLEEPPSYAIFILATTEKHKVLPTILSRCQIFDFKRITTNDTVAHLLKITEKENIKADEESLHVIAQKSEGCMRDALSILDQISSFTNGNLSYASTMEHLNQLDASFYFKITDSILAADVSQTLLYLDEVLERGFEGDVIINGFAAHFRNLLLCKDARMAKLLDVPNNHKPIYHEKAIQTPPSFILSALNVVNESELNYKSAQNKRLHTELCLIRLCYLLQATEATVVEKKNNLNEQPIATIPANSVATTTVYGAQSNKEIPASEPEITSNNSQTEKIIETPKREDGKEIQSATPSRRISKNMAQQLQNTEVEATTMQLSDFKMEHIEKIISDFKTRLKAENKSTVFNAFEQIKISMPEVGTIHLLSPNSITDGYAQSEKNTLQNLINESTGLILSITNSFEISEIEPKDKTKSKTEVYQEMAEKNPLLTQFKDALKMSIEY